MFETGWISLDFDSRSINWQGLLMIEEIDNKAPLLLANLASSDGASRAPPSTSSEALSGSARMARGAAGSEARQ